MSTITIELPDEVVPSAVWPEEFARELRLAAAIHGYRRGQISQGKGAQISRGWIDGASSSLWTVLAWTPSR